MTADLIAKLQRAERERDEALACLDDAKAASPAVQQAMAEFKVALAFRRRAEKAETALAKARNAVLEEAAIWVEKTFFDCELIVAAIRKLKVP